MKSYRTQFHRFNAWKALAYPDKIRSIINGETPTPVVWHIYPTNECCFDCDVCIMKEEKQRFKGGLPPELIEKAYLDARTVGIKLIHFSGGGEPLMSGGLWEFLRKKASGQYEEKPEEDAGFPKIAISTNGLKLVEDCSEPRTIGDKISLLKAVSHLRVSLNAINQQKHAEFFRYDPGKTYFQDIIRGIKSFIVDRTVNERNIDIGIAFLITPDNVQDVYEFCKLGNMMGVDFIHIRPTWYADKKKDEANMHAMAYANMLVDMAKDAFPNTFIHISQEKFEGWWTERGFDKCLATKLQAMMLADGSFCPCQDVWEPRWGNYHEQSFVEAWWSKEHDEALAKIDIEKCPRCVEGNSNLIIHRAFIDNDLRLELL